MSIVSDNIKHLRKTNGLTQEQFAQRIGIKRSLLGAYEEGRANPNLGNLMNIAKVFGISVDNLIESDLRQQAAGQVMSSSLPTGQATPPTAEAPAKEPKTTKPLPTIVEKYFRESEVKPVVTPPEGSNGTVNARAFVNKSYGKDSPTTVVPDGPDTDFFPTVARPKEEKVREGIRLVRQSQVTEYLHSHLHPDFLKKLPAIQLPTLPTGDYRAFEAGDDFAFPGAIIVGKPVKNWYDLKDGKHYVVIHHQKGILYRRVYNQVKIKGALLLSSDKTGMPSFETPVKEVLEAWEAQAFISMQMPEPALSLDRVSQLVADLQQELQRLKD